MRRTAAILRPLAVITLLFSISDAVCIALEAPANGTADSSLTLETDLDDRRPLSQDVYGANNECLFRPVWFDHPAYAEKYLSSGRPFFRFPGGTGSNFYNPFTGYYDDESPSTRDYSGHNQRIKQFTATVREGSRTST